MIDHKSKINYFRICIITILTICSLTAQTQVRIKKEIPRFAGFIFLNSIGNIQSNNKELNDSVILEKFDRSGSRWNPDSKHVLSYDSTGKNSSYVIYNRNTNFPIWDKYMKNDYSYDIHGNIVILKGFNWSWTDNDWEKNYLLERTYDDKGNETSFSYHEWFQEMNSWIGLVKYESEYNSSGKETMYADYNWDSDSSKWTGNIMTKTEYDQANNEKAIYYYNWNKYLNNWSYDYFKKCETTFTDNEKIRIYSVKEQKSGVFKEYSKSRYLSTITGDTLKEIFYIWDYNKSSWIQMSRTDNLTLQNGLKSLAVYDMDTIAGKWVGSMKFEWIYNNTGNRTYYAEYIWDSTAENWTGSNRHEKTFNDSGVELSETVYSFDKSAKVWKYDYKNENILSISGNILQYTGKDWDETTQDWINDKRSIYYYSQHIVNLEEINKDNFMIFQPDASSVICVFSDSIKKAGLNLYDLNGKAALSENIESYSRIDVSGLNHGIYLYSAIIDSQVYRGKIIIGN